MKPSKFKLCVYVLCGTILCVTGIEQVQAESAAQKHLLVPVSIQSVKIEDAFWGPRLNTWKEVTLKDVLDKFEAAGAFRNFDRVAGTLEGKHEGPPWFDGLIYETIRGASDFLISYPDQGLEQRLDGYIARIAAAQAKDPDGYIMTYTQLDEPEHRWGLNGGNLRWQHDVYNAGALVEAGVHYYRATGKVNLLEVAVRLANHMSDIMGPLPKKNIVPAHSLPEEALVELYLLFTEDASLQDNLAVRVHADRYLHLAEFWLEMRGRNCVESTSIPPDPKYGQRPCWGEYAQDHKPVFQQDTLEGHAVRATLMCAGLSAAARVNDKAGYAQASLRLWDNMVGKRMHITGGTGAFADEEKFGPDYVLPNDAYLETCAAVGAGFFHRNMNLLFGDARYIDELERALYNNVLNGVSLEGTHYYYQNPLSAKNHRRWRWHDCPCCPPMFLKMTAALPGYIYACDEKGLYVNLFVGSQAECSIRGNPVKVKQKTEYPWKGTVGITLNPLRDAEFAVSMRIPGWAAGQENPFGLYQSDLKSRVRLKVNGSEIKSPKIVRGYAAIERLWKKGDTIELELPMEPRRVYAHPAVEACRGRVAIQSGPLVYCVEEQDNPAVRSYFLGPDSRLSMTYEPELLGGVNVIKAAAWSVRQDGQVQDVSLRAIPFYCQDNRQKTADMEVWLPEHKESARPALIPTIANQSAITVSHCFANDTPDALNDGIEPANSNDHTIVRHTWWDHRGTAEWVQYEFNRQREVSSVSVYWWDDRPAGGQCAAPASWRLLHRTGEGQWHPMPGDIHYGTQKDRFNTVTFEAIQTDALRIEVRLAEPYSGGILEWKVE